MEDAVFHVIYVCHHIVPTVMNLEDFKAHLSQARYIWKPDLDVDSIIRHARVKISPIYRSLNLSCCTGVVAVAPINWSANDHMDEILAANQWYYDKLLVERSDLSLVTMAIPSMAAIIHLGDTLIVPLTEHNARELQYLKSKREVLEILDLDAGSSVPITDLPNRRRLMYLEIPRQNNLTVEQWLGGSPSNINWCNFLTGTRPYVYGREGRYREPAPLAEV